MVGLLTGFLMQGAASAQASDPLSDPEAHAVYAAVLKLRFSSDDKPLKTMTLLQQTRAALPLLCDLEQKIPQDWRPVLDDYKAQNEAPRPFPERLELGLPYSFVTLAALRRQMQAAGYDLSRSSGWQSPGAEVFARLAGGMLVTLSAVGFNTEKTRAMVTVQTNCFPLLEPAAEHRPCHEGRQLLMERERGGIWIPAKNVEACMWIA
jgi:hypothetical protein